MRTLQEKYNGVINENFSKKQFVRDARLELPNLITQFNGFEDTVTILKSKGMLQEAKKQEVPEYDKPAPGYSLEALERGIDAELEGMGINTAVKTPAKEDYDKAKEKAEKNLEKDPNHYLNLMSGDSKKVDKHDKYVEVKKNNHVDTFNGMKKAELKEENEINPVMNSDEPQDLNIKGERVTNEYKKKVLENAIADIKTVYPELDKETFKSFIHMHFNDLVNDPEIDIVDEFKAWASANDYGIPRGAAALDYIDEKKGKDHDGDGDIDVDDYMAAKDQAIKKDMGKDVNEVSPKLPKDIPLGAMAEFNKFVKDPSTLAQAILQFYNQLQAKEQVKFDQHPIFGNKVLRYLRDMVKPADRQQQQSAQDTEQTPVSEGRRSKMKGGKVVTENDYETGGYVESMGPMLDRVLKQLIAVWDEWKEGPMTEPAMIPFAKKDLLGYIGSQITEGEDIVDEVSQEHEELKEAFKAIISKVLTEEVITEAATGNLSNIASKYDDYEGMQAAINTLENIVTDVESYYGKTKEKIQKVYDSFKDIRNAEGLAVGALIGPAIEDAFRKDLMPVTEKGFTKGLEMPKVKMLSPDDIQEEELEEKETVFKPVTEGKKYKYTKRQI